MKYVAIYTLDLFVDVDEDPSRIVNTYCNTRNEAIEFLRKEKHSKNLSFWNPAIFNIDKKEYEDIAHKELI